MPQLNPAPWLAIMLTSWVVLLTLFNPKVHHVSQQNPPLVHNQAPHKITPWNWPWS